MYLPYSFTKQFYRLEAEKIKKEDEKEEDEEEKQDLETLALADEVRRLPSMKLESKVKGVDLISGGGAEFRLAISLANNTLELHSIRTVNKETECKHFSMR